MIWQKVIKMSKLKANINKPPQSSLGKFFRGGSGRKDEDSTPESKGNKKYEVYIASVQQAEKKRSSEHFIGVDEVKVLRVDGIQQDSANPVNAKPLNPYFKVVPMAGEQVLCVTDGTTHYYSDVINFANRLGENIPPKGASTTKDGNDYFFGLFSKPRDTKKMDPTEGDIVIEGRAGQTIRLTSTSEESFLGKLFGGKSENKPVMMITCNDDEEEGLGNEDIMEDDCSIYLASETPITTLKLESKIHKDYTKIDEYADGQIIMRSNRLVLSSKKENVIINSANKMCLSTKKWVVDIDELMDVIENIQKELDQLTKGAANFTTGVGPTGPTSNAALVAKIGTFIKKLKA